MLRKHAAWSGIILLLAAGLGGSGVVQADPVSPAAQAPPPNLAAVVPSAVRDGSAQRIGPHPGTAPLHLLFTLPLRDLAGLDAFMADVSNPQSARYGQYLTLDEANARFNPTVADEQRVVSWLRAHGITDLETAVNHLYVSARGSTAAFEALLGLQIDEYQVPGKTFYGPDRPPTLPAGVASSVAWVVGLSNEARFRMDNNGTAHGSAPYYPQDLANAYDVNPLWSAGYTGSGNGIGIVLWGGAPSDSTLNTWAAQTGAAVATRANGRLTLTSINGGSTCADVGEAGLDIEAAGAIAYQAPIHYYVGPVVGGCGSTEQPDLASLPMAENQAAVDGNRQINNSWSSDETSTVYQAFEGTLHSNSTTGHTFVFSSGDSGSASPFPPYTDPHPVYPASSVYVTTVGGTRFSGNIGSGWPGETAWAYTPGSPPTGSGGGYSQYFGRPTWQVAPGYSGTHRGYPDVSAVGDPNTGFFMCYGNSSTCIQVGGTSLSAPVWAGLLSIMNQYLAAQGKPIIGFASPKLYPLVNSAQPYPPFHDITSGTNGAYQCRTGWDEVTGLGSPDAWNLVRDLAAASSSTATPTATTTTPSPVVTNTPGVGPSNTPGVGPSNTPRPASPTPVSCTPGQFSDVPSGSPFYVYITDLVSRGAISGYADCTFRPFNTITRGQVAKVLVLGFGLSINTAGGPHFEDVPSGSAFYNFVETAYNLGIISGYSCGGPGEPCDSQNRPYFRPNTNVTRGQLAKMVSIGRGWALLNPSTATFADVPVGSAFYRYVETVAAKSIISGYNCGGPGEPCDSQNRPYFRQYNNATRGQGAKIIDLSIYASDSTPTNTPNAAPTNTRPPGPTNTPGVAPTNTPGPAPTNTPGPGLTNTPSPAPTTPPPASATRTATPGITGTATPTSVATQTPEPPPRITGFAPASVEQYDTETQINMTGTSFGLQQGAGFVVVNSHVATVDSWNDTLIQFHINVNTPPGNPVTVRLVRDDGQLVDQPTGFAVTPRQHPYVFSYLPNSVHQGDTLTTITINGTRFGTTPGTVTLLGVYSATITSWNDTQIQFHIAANTPPSSPISVVIYSPDNGSYKEYGLFAVLP